MLGPPCPCSQAAFLSRGREDRYSPASVVTAGSARFHLYLAYLYHIQFFLQAGKSRIIMASCTLSDCAPLLAAGIIAAHEED